MHELRERWEGVALPGGYLLQRWLGGDETAGFFETSLENDGRRAIVKLVPEQAADGGAQLALWERTRALRHDNLCALLACGRAELSGEIVVYGVFEGADDTLGAALAQAPLSEGEAREVLNAVLAAREYLGEHGLAPATLDPDGVVAVGEAIKLTTDALRDAAAGDGADELRTFWYRISPAGRERSARILSEAMGEESPGGDAGTSPAPPVVASGDAPPVYAAPRPPSAGESAMPRAGEPAGARPDSARPFPLWVGLGAVAVVALILWLHFQHDAEAPEAANPAAALALTPAPAAAPPVAAPKAVKPSPVGGAISARAAGPAPGDTAAWHVIAFTYRTYDDAARKAEQIRADHGDYQATVFTPAEKNGFYLVSLGAFATRDDALALQEKARGDHLARDVYVKKFME